jgi:hypothetical protein
MNTQMQDIGLVALSIALVVVAVMGLMRADKYLQIKAVDDCYKSSSYTSSPDEKTKIVYPLGDVNKNCLKDKGY